MIPWNHTKQANKKTVARVIFSVLITTAMVQLAVASITADGPGKNEIQTINGSSAKSGDSVAPRTSDITVISSQGFNEGQLSVIDENGTLLYRNTSYTFYMDIDPIVGTRSSLLVVGGQQLSPRSEHCKLELKHCYFQVVERLNYSTGEVERLWSEYVAFPLSVHDVDLIAPDRILIGDIGNDRVFIYNTTTGLVEWGWHAQSVIAIDTGGPYPTDWTHLNDVELLDDGRIMVSLRNQDRVVFIHPDQGFMANWTLGAEDDYSILYEQHNPDYIPEHRGGPAVLVADSENDRVIEYQRIGDRWVRTWLWQDEILSWPRDADRLPNGHTLIADSHGDRVIEVNRSGSIVWSTNISSPYEAERFYTGPESANGPSSIVAGDASSMSETEEESVAKSQFIPTKVQHGILFVLPNWMGITELFSLVAMILLAVVWGGLEFWWYSGPRPISVIRNA